MTPRLRQILWFILLWGAGLASVSALAVLIRMVMGAIG